MVPHITHRDLVAFAEDKVNLTKAEVDAQRAQVNNLRERIEAKIAVTPGFAFVKALNAGSVAKGTALSNAKDRDLAVYVRAELAPEELPKLVEWVRDRLVEIYPTMSEDQIVANTHCVTVRFSVSGLDVDVVPVLYMGEANDVGYLVSKTDDALHKTSVRLQLDFIRGRKKIHPRDLAQLIRFTKWWARQQKKRDGDFKCQSYMLELIWIHLADHGLVLDDYVDALEAFFGFIVDGGFDKQIAFTDFHKAADLPDRGTWPIQVLDPVNFDNNVAEFYEAADRDRLVAAAQDAFDAITTARYEPIKGMAVQMWQQVLGTAFKAAY
ncbi:nucleotidyltransferase [Catenulispora sp. NL8]|uniref:Nucleotidyltransferase n=1 Tax=Catenulispora pinistramenti TaxID=2705254 RepID=A0ABS5KSK9_9ACTN|nr:CBASS oligonucleotide cyclase [Catenulispora pinistramenti]MBS2549015.1 nucleotidyltransferase [Catenulispora pinistramenti]